MLSGYDREDLAGTALHEWGHRMEKTNKRILALQRAFYERRTSGEELKKLKDIYGGSYRDTEVTRTDKFAHAYMGKDYGKSAYELLSMGLERAFFFHNTPDEWDKDQEYIDFILGLLAAA